MTGEAIHALARRVKGPVLTEPDQLGRYQRDASHLRGSAVAAVLPVDVDDVVRTIRWARGARIPLVARGGGSSLDGESVPSAGGVVVDFSHWNAILEIDPARRLARVQPGVVNRELHRSLVNDGVFFPPNPGSWLVSTIGGNAATNASGPRSLKYGSTRRWVREARVVLGTGEVVMVGHRSSKRSAGPELLDWLVGSEGVLGWFLELTLTLAPLPEVRTGFVVARPERASLDRIVQTLARERGFELSAVEFIDRACAAELIQRSGGRLPRESDLVLLELETSRVDETRDLEALLGALPRAGFRDDPLVFPSADELWTLRGQSSVALDQALGERIREDIAVPAGQLDQLLEIVHAIGDRHGAAVYVFGHLGDGNLHPNFVIDPASPEADALREDLWKATHQLGGTISAEHGIGSVKAHALAYEHSAAALRLYRRVKRELDPDGILNPGKLFPRLAAGEDGPDGSLPGDEGADGTPPE